MKVEVLYVPGCPNHEPALAYVQKVLASEGIEAELREILVSSQEQATQLGFPGSPTIRVDGQDIEQAKGGHVGMACRLYANRSGVPSEESLRSAVSRARK